MKWYYRRVLDKGEAVRILLINPRYGHANAEAFVNEAKKRSQVVEIVEATNEIADDALDCPDLLQKTRQAIQVGRPFTHILVYLSLTWCQSFYVNLGIAAAESRANLLSMEYGDYSDSGPDSYVRELSKTLPPTEEAGG